MTRSPLAGAAVLLVLWASMGASCSQRLSSPFAVTAPPLPVVLQPTASAAEVVAAVNQNASRIQTYQASSASISMPDSAGLPLVSASIAVERPNRFRLRAVTALTGPEVDLGSNDERFWVWARRNEPPALYTARHDAWAASPARRQLPIEPRWLVDALGLTVLDPNAVYVGPVPRGDGTLELQTQVAGPAGPRQRVLMIDAQSAVIREQHVYDEAGSLAASVFADRYRFDATAQASIPERVRIVVPTTQMDLTITTGPIVLNAPIADGGRLWALPQLGNHPTVDLSSPAAGPLGFGATEPIVTPFTAPEVAQTPMTVAAEPAVPLSSVPRVAATPKPAASGFVGLPTGGRVVE